VPTRGREGRAAGCRRRRRPTVAAATPPPTGRSRRRPGARTRHGRAGRDRLILRRRDHRLPGLCVPGQATCAHVHGTIRRCKADVSARIGLFRFRLVPTVFVPRHRLAPGRTALLSNGGLGSRQGKGGVSLSPRRLQIVHARRVRRSLCELIEEFFRLAAVVVATAHHAPPGHPPRLFGQVSIRQARAHPQRRRSLPLLDSPTPR